MKNIRLRVCHTCWTIYFLLWRQIQANVQWLYTKCLALAETVGVPIKSENMQSPTTCIVIYGIAIDSEAMVARLSQAKNDNILGLLKIFKVRRKVTLRELQSLLGLLNFACSVIIPGRAFLRRLFD